MHYVLITHEVDDYAAWKQGFDAAADRRKRAGELSFQVLRDEADANRVVHFSRWSSLAAAKQFFESAEVAQIRADLGVRDPDFLYLDELESGQL